MVDPHPRLPTEMIALLDRAVRYIHSDECVAFPTETVYGLGANALSDTAILTLYQLKGRPGTNPLIVHVTDMDQAMAYATFSPMAQRLAEKFWPGPLTIVLPQTSSSPLSRHVTGGLPTVAIRCPHHPIAHAFIHACGVPIAAPSANPSGFLSATTPDHIKRHLGQHVFVIEDGSSPMGLESTIVDMTGHTPLILRPGYITSQDIESIIDQPTAHSHDTGMIKKAPGQLDSHYAPRSPLRLNVMDPGPKDGWLHFGAHPPSPHPFYLNLSPEGDLRHAAHHLYSMLHHLDDMVISHGLRGIVVSPIPFEGIGLAINERLARAASQPMLD